MKAVHFQPRRGGTPTGWLISTAVVLILGLTAFVFPDSTSLELLRIENRQWNDRKARALSSTDSRAAFKTVAWDGELEERTRKAAEELDELFPAELSELDVYEALRLVAALNELELSDLNVGEAEPMLNATSEFPLGVRKASLRGRAPLNELRSFLKDLESLGVPLTVRNVELTSDASKDGDLDFALGLALYHKLSEFDDSDVSRSEP